MAVTLTKRNYISLADVQAEEATATLAQVDRAEQAIDDYVGYQQRHIETGFRDTISALSNSNKTIADTANTSQLHQRDGYFKNCVIEIIGGTGIGQVRTITNSDYDDYSVTITDAWDTAPDTTSFFRIYQLGKFPRAKDVYQTPDGLTYHKSIPDAVKQAVIAQVAFIIAKGDAFFESDDTDKDSETIDNYSYSRGGGGAQASAVRLLSPRARTLLRGYKNSLGTLSAENSTNL